MVIDVPGFFSDAQGCSMLVDVHKMFNDVQRCIRAFNTSQHSSSSLAICTVTVLTDSAILYKSSTHPKTPRPKQKRPLP